MGTRPSSGWMPTRLLKWTSMPTSRRRSRECATQSSPSCTRLLAVLQVVCQEECLAVCPVACPELLVPEVPDPPSRRSIKLSRQHLLVRPCFGNRNPYLSVIFGNLTIHEFLFLLKVKI